MASSVNETSEYAIEVNDVTMIFNMASESLTNLKEYFIKLIRRELFFKEFRALKNISFKVRRGEVVGLVGTNGSGKSTMLKIIAGVLEPSEGECVVRGNIAPLIELGAGFDPELTARENIYLNGSLLGYTKEFIDDNLEGIIEFAELQDFMDMPLKNFSSGMTARIAFAIATITEPDILIVDETLSVGDVFFQEKCERRIQRFIESGDVTVLFVSHSISQVERICQRAIWIEKGDLRMDGPVNEVCEAYRNQFN
ncbi:ABC transporter ATP-binding protein [Collinsella ihumii]|uniref:ABC transporter ATP-binding protein n=1 Tax=Collinsella ihumii TaxID=1720204 RepID=A0A921IPU0_9ACTN|nr:ABC transporter ATP-binding protein [Collinsella ihumii]MBM6905689.1 ABC transporter ATP-binding protein [Collinsella tanakaei]MDN0064779.1 ABC transporter ATP-binding protein [Collinsella ihumii]MDN0068395.1 ABC transporter ATP-binding protein [Collinsella ihumii]HJG29827.1 ABC transporter ATP-binding protein [Collinsella ihumii]